MSLAVKTVGVVTAMHKPEAVAASRQLFAALHAAGVEVRARTDMASCASAGVELCEDAKVAASDLVIVLGGDGSLIAIARHTAQLGTPLLGVDMGSFGFLAEESWEDLRSSLFEVLAGNGTCEERRMVQADVWRGGECVTQMIGLNDAVIRRALPNRLMRLHTAVDGEYIGTYPADGIIIATPTGSTAYNLSAGGPIVDPSVEALILTAICAHTLYTRPLVVGAHSVVEITLEDERHAGEGVSLTIDGQQSVSLSADDRVVIKQAEYSIKLLRIGQAGFYRRLRNKLHWGTEK